jgi:hypothetical protein
MKTLVSAAMICFVLPLVVTAAPPSPSQAPAQAPNKAVQAPAQAPSKAVQAPMQAPNKTAQATTGYRTYSYMPGSAPANYNYNNNYYYNNNPNNGRPAFFSGHQPADYKVRGEFWAR